MDIVNLAIPVVGALGAFLLALLALKQRTLLDFFGRGIDQTQALKDLPDKHRLDGLEIIENTLKIDTISTTGLSADQTHSIILETLNHRRRQAHAKFVLYIVFSAIVLVIALSFVYYQLFFDTKSKIEAAMSDDKDAAAHILKRFDFYAQDDPGLVERLAKETAFPTGENAYASLMDKICNNPRSETCNEVIRDLRLKAKAGQPPFNDVGIPVRFGVAAGAAEPKRFSLHVSPSFEYARRVVEISYKGRRLVLYAEPRMGPMTDRNYVHLNAAQADVLRAPRANNEASGLGIDDPYKDAAFIVAMTQADPTLYDPDCPNYWNNDRNPSRCGKPAELPLEDYLKAAAGA